MRNGNGNGERWLNFYRAGLAAAMALLIAMVSHVGRTALTKLDTLSLLAAGQTVKIEALDTRLTNVEADMRGQDYRLGENSARLRVLESQ